MMMHSYLKSHLPAPLWKRLGQIKKCSNLAWEDIRVNLLGQLWPMSPTAISLMANDICNSRCQMCLIWQQKKDKEITPAELKQILDEPLFRNVIDIGVTGGEPTLRSDLPELFRVIAQKRPRISSASIITNAIREEQVVERVLVCARICREHNIYFSVSVSLDGVSNIHDELRGRDGNFATAVACIDAFRDAQVPVFFGATITKTNVYHVDELHEWGLERNIYGRFRIAEFIQRLYNDPQKAFIRNFDERERYHLGLFFLRLQRYEPSSTVRKTYCNIIEMLTDGERRRGGCTYQVNTVVLSSRGELIYCSPKSPNLGTILQTGSAAKVYFSNLGKRAEIKKTHCNDCIHYDRLPVTFREQVGFYLENRRISRVYDLPRLMRKTRSLSPARIFKRVDKIRGGRVLIVGWYGTETAGDKAILWSIVQRLRARDVPPRAITVSSYHPWITCRTFREMGLEQIQTVELYSREFEKICDEADEVIVGGGPLMELEGLNHILFAFDKVYRRGGINRIEGCGIGPLHSDFYRDVVARLLKLSNHITLRDKESADWSKCHAGREPNAVTPDPAVDFLDAVRRDAFQQPFPLSDEVVPTEMREISCYFREWPLVFSGSVPEKDFAEALNRFETELAGLVAAVMRELNAPLRLLPMHSSVAGGDDRIFNRRFAAAVRAQLDLPLAVLPVRQPFTPLELARSMQNSQFCFCMRFHSVVFAETLGRPYLAVDYTRNGKVANFLRGVKKTERMFTIDEILSGEWRQTLPRRLDAAGLSAFAKQLRFPSSMLGVNISGASK